MSTSKYIFLAVCTTMVIMIEGNTFLRTVPKHKAARVSEQDVQNSLLEEIEGSLGTGIAAKRISDIHALLGPMFVSLPKNQHGNLDHVTARYALHRVFIQRHGWAIQGLDPAGEAWNSSSPAGILKNQVPSYVQNLFEKRLGGRGLSVHELAVFAATIEHLIHNEAIGRLGSALQAHDLLPTALISPAQADQVLDAYMMAYILGQPLPEMSSSEAQRLLTRMPEMIPAWSDTQTFVRKVRQDITNTLQRSGEQQLDFATLVRIAETIGEQYGKFQDAECKGLKATLMKIEDRGSGRVRLSDFYKYALSGEEGAWHFQESVGYLRQLGALDESNSDEPRLMMSNYILSQTNCIASSDYYSVCCINECEDLLGDLEKKIAAAEATPARILELISGLPSSSVSASRVVSRTLRARLEDIAAHHGGLVQLHGRLFNQWMHHAYPRECPFPHVAGTTIQTKADQRSETSASKEEMWQFTSMSNSEKNTSVKVEDAHDLMMWHHEEELLVRKASDRGPGYFMIGVRSLARVAVFATMASLVFGLVRTMTTSGHTAKAEKYLV